MKLIMPKDTVACKGNRGEREGKGIDNRLEKTAIRFYQ